MKSIHVYHIKSKNNWDSPFLPKRGNRNAAWDVYLQFGKNLLFVSSISVISFVSLLSSI